MNNFLSSWAFLLAISALFDSSSCYNFRRKLYLSHFESHHNVSRSSYMADSTLDSNMVVAFTALLCALISIVGLIAMARCAILHCGQRMEPRGPDVSENQNASTGMAVMAVKALPTIICSKRSQLIGTDCPICLVEFKDGDKLRLLPKCSHCFHVRCIGIWLFSHSSCPSCRNSLLDYVSDKNSTAVFLYTDSQHVQNG
eukprot:Gb_14778 [translate_table: standard]